MSTDAQAVICGAGIAGIAAAHFLARAGVRNVVLVDERRPLTLTSDKSTEAYRNWWPGPDDAMLRLMNRSIDLLEELAEGTGNAFHLNRRGYFYCTADPARADRLHATAQQAAEMGAGPLRVHDGRPGAPPYVPAPDRGWRGGPETPADGADFITDPALLRGHFGWLAGDTVAVLHARRCGWFSGQQLGMHLLEQARAAGVTLLSGRVVGVETAGGRVAAVRVEGSGGATRIQTPAFVNAAGPLARAVGRLAGAELPLFSERHLKVAFEDSLGAVPRTTGLVICEDPIALPWDDDARAELAAADETRWLTEALPAGAHLRPEGHGPDARTLLLLWAYHAGAVAETFPVALDPDFTEVALRGLARLVPGLEPYTRRLPKAYLDGGYYTKTRENRPLIGPAGVDGGYVLAGLSGFGLMAACAAGELLAAHVSGAALPDYAPAFLPARYDDPAYRAKLDTWGDTGQL